MEGFVIGFETHAGGLDFDTAAKVNAHEGWRDFATKSKAENCHGPADKICCRLAPDSVETSY